MTYREIKFAPDILPQTDEEIHSFMAEAYDTNTSIRMGGKNEIKKEIFNHMMERNASVSEIWNLFNNQSTPPIEHPHPLTQEQEDDLQKGVLKDFGPPLFKL